MIKPAMKKRTVKIQDAGLVLSSKFMEMPKTAQLLYFYLSLLADDNDYVDSATTRAVMDRIGADIDDMEILILNHYACSVGDLFIIATPFERR